MNITAGVSFDSYKGFPTLEGVTLDRDQVDPKVGLTWNITPDTTVLTAAFRVLKRTLNANQTVEPTQVAGFNQFFDESSGTDYRRYGISVDHKFSGKLCGGSELSWRVLEVPFTFFPAPPQSAETRLDEWKENTLRAYLYLTPHRSLAASME